VWFFTSYVYLRMLIVNGKMLLKKKKNPIWLHFISIVTLDVFICF